MKRKAKRMTGRTARQPLIRKKAILSNRIRGYGYQMPPEYDLVAIYFDQKDQADQVRPFYDHYEQAYWLTPKGSRIRNWKVLATEWIFNFQQEDKLRQRLAINQSVFNDM